MSVSQVDGRILAAPVKFNRKGVVRFAHIELERADGRTERIAKPVATVSRHGTHKLRSNNGFEIFCHHGR